MRYFNHTLFLLFLMVFSSEAVAQIFPCNGDYYFSKVLWGKTYFYRFNSAALTFELVSEPATSFNGMGFNPADNYIYAIHGGSEMVRLDVNGQLTSLGAVNGLTPDDYWAADFSPEGEYILTGGASKIVRINVSGLTATVLSVSEKYYSNGSGNGNPNIGDIAFDPATGICYGYDSNTRRLARIDPATGEVDAFGDYQPGISVVGAIYSDVKGRLHGFVFNEIYDIDKNTGVFTYRGDAPYNEGGIDACSCPYYVDLEKEVSRPKVCAGDTVQYTFTITNSSQEALTGIDFFDQLPGSLQFLTAPSGLSGGSLAPNSGPGYDRVEIENMVLSPGLTTFSLQVKIPEDVDQLLILKNQAELSGFSSSLLSAIVLSDDPATEEQDDSTELQVSPAPDYAIGIQDSGPHCAGDTVVLQASAPEAGTFRWTFPDGGQLDASTVAVTDIQSGPDERYSLAFVNEFGCRVDTFAEVVFYPSPYLDLGPDTALCLSTPSILYPGDFQQYSWQDGTAADRLYVEEYGTYWVAVTNEYGCMAEDTVLISPGCPTEVYVPNAFSPNGDGINDIFNIYALEVAQFRMWIFDRWGELVSEGTDMQAGWDGTFRGKQMSPGVYVYRMEVEFLNGNIIRKAGDVVLLR